MANFDDFDTTTILDKVVGDWWNTRSMLDGRKAWEEVDLDDQNKIKEDVLPFVYRTLPLAAVHVVTNINRTIAAAREQGFTDGEVLTLIGNEFGVKVSG